LAPRRNIAVIGLGYVGLPVAVAFASSGFSVVGFDIDRERIEELHAGFDRTREVDKKALAQSTLAYCCEPEALAQADFFIITVPTPIDASRRPDLSAVFRAAETVGQVLKRGDIVVFESTVYPGVVEEECGPILERASGLRCGHDFKLGYSPERINPGDKEHRFETITKVVAGQDEKTLQIVAETYGAVVKAGIHCAPSIKVAEAAKVIENAQRDLNIAFMNELSALFDRLGIDTGDVLAAAGTKWNFYKFTPGLVGGHCIGVDPYYLTHKADKLGYHPQVILAGRRINDGMGKYVAEQTVKQMIQNGTPVKGAHVNVLGLTFKENCPDIRNSRVVDVIHELASYGVTVHVHDPIADPAEALREYGVQITAWDSLPRARAIVAAVAHREYRQRRPEDYAGKLEPGGLFVDVKCQADASALRALGVSVWRL